MLATQDVLTYCTTRTLTYHLYADEIISLCNDLIEAHANAGFPVF